MRGKEGRIAIWACMTGITPAYAGKRTLFCLAGRRNRDHPRVCGEKIASWTVCRVSMGSPPRMRGKEDKKEPLCGSFGITPAYAGKSDAACIHGAVVGDHPRVCGEKWPAALYEEMERGITPAYAGKSFSSSSSFVLYWDHPRVCGEKVLPLWLCVGSSGSPPRMRGKAGPADAGRKQLRDHPRVCGEKPRTFSRRSPKPGSPPRMRGKGRKAAPSYLDLRITPAYAGKSPRRA